MKHLIFFTTILLTFSTLSVSAKEKQISSHWNGKNVVFIGDSITDKNKVGTTKNYWEYLQEYMGLNAIVYATSGDNFINSLKKAEKLSTEKSQDDVDAILIFVGTNDYMGSTTLGQWYTLSNQPAPVANDKTEIRPRREFSTDSKTFKGRINNLMLLLKDKYPQSQIIFLTPLHRGFAKFSKRNVQADETFPNRGGIYVDAYVEAIKEISNIWAVPVIDLNAISGLFPNMPSHAIYFNKDANDLLHPNALGHKRMAKAIAYVLQSYPADFK